MRKLLILFFTLFFSCAIFAAPKSGITATITFQPGTNHLISFRIWQGYWATVGGTSPSKASEVLPQILAQVPSSSSNKLEFGYYNPTIPGEYHTLWFSSTCLFTLNQNTLSLNLLITKNVCQNSD